MVGPAPRQTRVNETRSTETRSNLAREMPKSRHVGKLYIDRAEIPPGMDYSWVAIEQMQTPDYARADEQSAKGWTPVPRSRHSRFRNGGSLIPGRAETDPYAQFIKVGGSLLCERPEQDVLEDKAHLAEQAAERMRSISRWRNGEGVDPLMPRVDNSTAPEMGYAASFKKD